MSITEDRLEDSQVYELGYLILPSYPEDKLPQVVETIKKIINDAGGTEIASEDPFLQDLAYAMSKSVGASKYVVNDAYLGWIKFELPYSDSEKHPVEMVKTNVEKLDEVLRLLLIKTTRETHFTFAQALEARREKEEAEDEEARDKSGDVAEEVPVVEVVVDDTIKDII